MLKKYRKQKDSKHIITRKGAQNNNLKNYSIFIKSYFGILYLKRTKKKITE